MTRCASLGMYDGGALAVANDDLWAALAARLHAAGLAGVPERLDRSRPLAAIWDDPDLLLAQTCGYPLATRWRGRLRYVATPLYRAPGCDGALHRSRIVVRHDDAVATLAGLRGRRAAVNDAQSNTGMNLFRAAVAPLAIDGRFFASVGETGSHRASVAAVAAGEADVAAIDCVTFAHLERSDPTLTRAVRTLAWTAPSPGLPLVTGIATSDRDLRLIRRALRVTLRDASAPGVAALRIDGVEVVRAGRYDRLATLGTRGDRGRYPQLA